jgi:YNFM family putative membrane transporter
MAGPAPGVRRGTADYWRISIALFLAGFATFSLLYCVQPLLPVFTRAFGVSPASSSLALSLSTGFLAFAIMCAAALSEAAGRRGLIFASMAGAALLNIAAAYAPGWHALLLCRALEGFTLGGVPAVAMAYLAEEIERESLGSIMGLYVGGTAFGGMAGRVGAGILVEHLSWRATLGVIGLVDLVFAIGFLALLPASRNFIRRAGFDAGYHRRAWGAHLSRGSMSALFAIGFLVMGAFVTAYNYAGFRLMAPPFNLSQTAIGLIFAVYVFGIAASALAGSLADRFGRGTVLLSGFVIALAGLALTLSGSLAVIVTGVAGLTVGFFMAHSVASGWVGRMAAGTKGHASSLYLLAYYLGSSVAGTAGGWFWSAGAWGGVVLFAGALLLIGTCLSLVLAVSDKA